MISYLIIIAFFIYILFKIYRSFKAKNLLNNITIVGYSNYKYITNTLVLLFLVPFILTLESQFKFALLILLYGLLSTVDRAYLGSNGIKVNDAFIPKEDILGCFMVDGRTDRFELFARGKECLIRVTVNTRKMERELDEALAEWSMANKNEASS